MSCRARKELSQSLEMFKEEIASALKKQCFVLHHYKAYSTESHYLKMDGGVAGSLRISDHKGIDKYHYRFNLMMNKRGRTYKRSEKYEQFFYGPDAIEQLIDDIVEYRRFKQMVLTVQGYAREVSAKVGSLRENKGFGKQCIRV